MCRCQHATRTNSSLQTGWPPGTQVGFADKPWNGDVLMSIAIANFQRAAVTQHDACRALSSLRDVNNRRTRRSRWRSRWRSMHMLCFVSLSRGAQCMYTYGGSQQRLNSVNSTRCRGPGNCNAHASGQLQTRVARVVVSCGGVAPSSEESWRQCWVRIMAF